MSYNTWPFFACRRLSEVWPCSFSLLISRDYSWAFLHSLLSQSSLFYVWPFKSRPVSLPQFQMQIGMAFSLWESLPWCDMTKGYLAAPQAKGLWSPWVFSWLCPEASCWWPPLHHWLGDEPGKRNDFSVYWIITPITRVITYTFVSLTYTLVHFLILWHIVLFFNGKGLHITNSHLSYEFLITFEAYVFPFLILTIYFLSLWSFPFFLM